MPTSSPRQARHRYFAWLLRHRQLVITVAGSLAAAGMVGAARVRIEVDVEQFIPAWGAVRAVYNDYKRSFSKEDTRFSVFWQSRHSPGAGLYRELEQIARRFEAIGLEDVHWIGGMDVADQVEVEGERTLGLHPLVQLDSLSDSYVRRVLEKYRNDALYRGYLWNADQTVFSVHGHLPESWNHDQKRSEVEATLTDQLDSLAANGVRMAFSGIPVFRSRSPRLLRSDILVFLGGGLVLAFGGHFLSGWYDDTRYRPWLEWPRTYPGNSLRTP